MADRLGMTPEQRYLSLQTDHRVCYVYINNRTAFLKSLNPLDQTSAQTSAQTLYPTLTLLLHIERPPSPFLSLVVVADAVPAAVVAVGIASAEPPRPLPTTIHPALPPLSTTL